MLPKRDLCQLGRVKAFTLIEVVLALAIVTFAVVAMISLLATGLQSQRQSSEDVQSVNLASEIIEQRRAAPTNSIATTTNSIAFILPPLNANSISTNYLTIDGTLAATVAQRYYRIVYNIQTNSSGVAQIYVSLNAPWQSQTPVAIKSQCEIVTYVRLP